MIEAASPIVLRQLQDLWLHTGTACNLSCPFCHEGSKPGDERLQGLTLEEVAPLLDQAAATGVQRFVFTGGEPLILRGIQSLLLHALRLRPVLVLTNGTAPFIRRSHHLATLRAAAHPLSFNVSIDTPDEAAHDAGRGLKNFRKALEGLRLLHAAGFAVGITRQQHPGEIPLLVEQRFRQLLRKHGLPEDLPIVALPQLGALDEPAAASLAEAAGTAPGAPLCSRGRMLIKRAGTLRLTACPLVDDDPAFDAAADLAAAINRPVIPSHKRCGLCHGRGVNYIGVDPPGGV